MLCFECGWVGSIVGMKKGKSRFYTRDAWDIMFRPVFSPPMLKRQIRCGKLDFVKSSVKQWYQMLMSLCARPIVYSLSSPLAAILASTFDL